MNDISSLPSHHTHFFTNFLAGSALFGGVAGAVIGILRHGKAGRAGELERNLARLTRENAELQGNRRRMTLALEGGDLGTWDWNIITGATVFNDRWSDMPGYAPDEIEPHYGPGNA